MHLSLGVELSLLRSKLILESFDFVGGVGKYILHFFLVITVDLVELELLAGDRDVKRAREILCWPMLVV